MVKSEKKVILILGTIFAVLVTVVSVQQKLSLMEGKVGSLGKPIELESQATTRTRRKLSFLS